MKTTTDVINRVLELDENNIGRALGHPCKNTCSGYSQGFLDGNLDSAPQLAKALNEAVDTLAIISGKHERYCCDDIVDCEFKAEEALEKINQIMEGKEE